MERPFPLSQPTPEAVQEKARRLAQQRLAAEEARARLAAEAAALERDQEAVRSALEAQKAPIAAEIERLEARLTAVRADKQRALEALRASDAFKRSDKKGDLIAAASAPYNDRELVGQLNDLNRQLREIGNERELIARKRAELAALDSRAPTLTAREVAFGRAYCQGGHVAHGGPCPSCRTVDSIRRSPEAIRRVDALHRALKAAVDPMARLMQARARSPAKTIDDILRSPAEHGLPHPFPTKEQLAQTARDLGFRGDEAQLLSSLEQIAGGKMLGTMLCMNEKGEVVQINGFSGPALPADPARWAHPDTITDVRNLRNPGQAIRPLSAAEQAGNSLDLEVGAGRCAAQRLVREVQDRNAAGALERPPRFLIPLAVAEIWVKAIPEAPQPAQAAAEEDLSFKKNDGELYESCFTCRSLLGPSLCGIRDMRRAHQDAVNRAYHSIDDPPLAPEEM